MTSVLFTLGRYGTNCCEIEFPAYWNFFVKVRVRVRLTLALTLALTLTLTLTRGA